MVCFHRIYPGNLTSYLSPGILFLLTIQAGHALIYSPHSFRLSSTGSKHVAQQRLTLLAYIAITFILATIGFAGNAKYTEMIWIDLRDAPGGPATLIELELDYWVNRMALAR